MLCSYTVSLDAWCSFEAPMIIDYKLTWKFLTFVRRWLSYYFRMSFQLVHVLQMPMDSLVLPTELCPACVESFIKLTFDELSLSSLRLSCLHRVLLDHVSTYQSNYKLGCMVISWIHNSISITQTVSRVLLTVIKSCLTIQLSALMLY